MMGLGLYAGAPMIGLRIVLERFGDIGGHYMHLSCASQSYRANLPHLECEKSFAPELHRAAARQRNFWL